MKLRDRLSYPFGKSEKPVDGDGDGKVYDGTPKERPATPQEIARGKKLRAGKIKGKGASEYKRPQKWVVRGIDPKTGEIETSTVGSKDEALAAAMGLADRKFRNVKASQIGTSAKKPSAEAAAKKPSAPTPNARRDDSGPTKPSTPDTKPESAPEAKTPDARPEAKPSKPKAQTGGLKMPWDKEPEPKKEVNPEVIRRRKQAKLKALVTEAQTKVNATEQEWGGADIPKGHRLDVQREAWRARLKVRRKNLADFRAKPIDAPEADAPEADAPEAPKKSGTPNKPDVDKPDAPDKPNKPDAPEGDDSYGPDPTTADQQKKPGKMHPMAQKSMEDYGLDDLGMPEEQKEAAANYMGMMDAALQGDRNAYNQLLKDYLTSSEDMVDDDSFYEKLDDLFGGLDQKLVDMLDQTLDSYGHGDMAKHRANMKEHGDPLYDAAAVAAAKKTPAYKALSGGASIGDAPSDGLIDSIRAMPDRFDLEMNANSGISENWWVTDKKTGERWMAKGGHTVTAKNGDPVIANDHFNEVMAYSVFADTNIDIIETKFASSAADSGTWLMQRDAGQQFGSGPKSMFQSEAVMDSEKFYVAIDKGMTVKKIKSIVDFDELGKLEDPGSFMDMILTDYLMGGHDRHPGNWMLHRNGDKYKLQVVDNGGTFASLDEPITDFIDYMFGNAEETTNNNLGNLFIARELLNGDARQINGRIQKFLKEMGAVKEAAIRERMKASGVTSKQVKLMNKHLKALRQRIDYLQDNSEEIAEQIMEME